MYAQLPRYDTRIPARRTLDRDHAHLATLLRPGLSVLDVGCANGALTAGIAEAVGPTGMVVGIDRNPERLEAARSEHRAFPNLRFESGDAMTLPYRAQFDIVTAARTLQWIADPALALTHMIEAAKPNGLIVALDFNHVRTKWLPDPPPEFARYFRAFLDWREANHLDNQIGDHLPALFRSAGLLDIESHVQDEIVERGDTEFLERASLWSDVMDNSAPVVTQAFLTQAQLKAAAQSYAAWIRTDLQKQTLELRAVTGRVPYSSRIS